MKIRRRRLLQHLAAIGAVLAYPRWLFAKRPDAAFESDTAQGALQSLFGQAIPESDQLTLKIPEIAENGAVVPLSISTTLEHVQSISVVVDKNPTPLAAMFVLSPQSVADISVRIKMAETSKVHAIVNAGGNLYSTSKEVKVTIGGCGG